MKKMLTLLLIVVAQMNVVLADDVSQEKALQVAREFAVVQTAKQTNIRKNPVALTPKMAYQLKSKLSDKANVYVVNLGGNQGFVVMSAESNAPDAILGYCDHGSFCFADAPIQLKDLLNSYSAGIDELRKNPSKANKAPKKASGEDIGTIVVGPLLTTTWNQWGPYNGLCPTGCPTGCVPTAVAQIMNYWKWPKQTIGELPNGENFSGHTYDWDNMLDDYSSGYNAAQANAVAQLMADIGLALGTMYSPEGSGTATNFAPLHTNFGYEADLIVSSDNLPVAMKAELDQNRPMLYSAGSNTGQGGGHEMVCDGYTTNDYFHFNYGWGGSYDGFYKQAAIFNVQPSIVTNIRPYEAVYKTIDDMEYALQQNGEAQIIRYTRSGVYDVVLDIPSTITDEGKTYKVTRIAKNAFSSKGHFSKLTLGDNIREIGRFAFIGSYIDTLIISDKVEVIPDESFRLTNVKALTIGASVKRIGKQAFAYCKLTKVTSKSPAFEVDDMAFYAVSEPDCGPWLGCITKLGKRAFGMTNFKKVPSFDLLEEIGSQAFVSCTLSANTLLPPKLKTISPDAFDMSAFKGFSSNDANPYFTSRYSYGLFNKSGTSLVMSGGYDNLRNYWYSEPILKLEPNSIRGKTNYTGFSIPNTVVEMEGAFGECDNLYSLECHLAVPPVISDETFNDKIFENKPDIKLYVPKGTAELYRNAPGWRKFSYIYDELEYEPIPDAEREYYMVLHRNSDGQPMVSVPVSQVDNMQITGTGDTQKVIVRMSGRDNISSLVTEVDSITWRPGFVYDSAEIFELNDSTLTAKGQKCEVTFEPTAIDEDVQLCIRNMVFTPNVLEGTLRGYAVDLTLSNDEHDLSGTAEIVMPITLEDNEKIHAAYYNEETGEWESVYFRYDENRQAVVITTDHLTLFSIFTTNNAYNNNAYVELLYAVWPQLYTLNEAAEVLLEIVSSDDPMERIKEFKDEMQLWQSISIDGGYSMLSSIGFSSEAIDGAVSLLGNFGTFLSILDIMKAEMEGNDVGVAAGTLSLIMNQTVGTMAAAIGTPIMSAAMGCVAFIGIALNKFGTMVQERKVDLFREATRIYFSKRGRSKYGTPYRSAKDWFNFAFRKF